MRALICSQFGGFEELKISELPPPDAGPGEVVLDVAYAGFNFPDTLIVQGLYQVKPPFPFSPGGEASGVVSAVGEGVSHVSVGDRAVALDSHGAFREQWVVRADMVRKIPDGMQLDIAAAMTLTYGTSYYALTERAQITAGESLLVLGASGGVGRAAVELGKALGAHVIAAASTPSKLEVAKAAGADELINYSEQPIKETVKALTQGKGVDVTYDPVGGDITESAFRAMAWGGRHLVVGFASGTIPRLPLNLPLLKSASVVGVLWGTWSRLDPRAALKSLSALDRMTLDGTIQPLISETFSFGNYLAAFQHLANRKAVGKVVLKF